MIIKHKDVKTGMEVKEAFLAKGITLVEKFLKKLHATQVEISKKISELTSLSLDSFSEIIQSDLQKMIHCSQQALKIIQKAYDLEEKRVRGEKSWKEIRHDLRASVGAIAGYGELILEELEEVRQSQRTTFLKLREIKELVQEQLPFIDKLKIEEENLPPLLTKKEDKEEIGQENPKIPHRESKIMVVDDDTHKRHIFSRRLKKKGYQVILAENGYSALDILRSELPDLILLDIMMPGMSGIEVLKEIKSNDCFKNIPILVISSLNDVENVVECIKLGADDYLPTPFNSVLFLARIHACLDKKILRDREEENLKDLERMRKQLEAALESIKDGFVVFNMFDEMTMSNRKFQELYPVVQNITYENYSYRQFLETNYKSGRYLFDKKRKYDDQEEFEDWVELRMARHQFAKEPYMEQLNDGRWIEISENRTPDGGTVSIHKDVTHSKENEDRLKFLAHHDPLTGLANRTLFDQSLQVIFETSIKNQEGFGVMYLDLDEFKNVNDTMGHEFGDYLLTQVSKELRKNVREKDIVARLGGDEFAIIVCGIDDLNLLKNLAERILKALGNKIVRDSKTANFGVSIGIALFPRDGISAQKILEKADQAMYAAKKAGKGLFKAAADLV